MKRNDSNKYFDYNVVYDLGRWIVVVNRRKIRVWFENIYLIFLKNEWMNFIYVSKMLNKLLDIWNYCVNLN